MVLAQVSEIAIDGLSRSIHSPRGTNMNRRHTTCLSRSSDHRVMDYPAGPPTDGQPAARSFAASWPCGLHRACRKSRCHADDSALIVRRSLC
jgi:hypothetical protein